MMQGIWHGHANMAFETVDKEEPLLETIRPRRFLRRERYDRTARVIRIILRIYSQSKTAACPMWAAGTAPLQRGTWSW